MIGGPVEVSGSGTPGILAPSGSTGPSPTNMNLSGNLTLDSGAILDFNLSSTPDGTNTPSSLNDHVTVGGAFSITTGGTLNINAPGGIGVGTYQLIDYNIGSFGGPFTANLAGWSVGAGYQSQYSYSFSTAVNGQFDLVVGSSLTNGSGTWISNSDSRYGFASNWSSVLVPNNTPGNYYTATFGGTSPSNGQQYNILLENSSNQATNFTVGGLDFTNTTYYYVIGSDGAGSLTLDNGGNGGGPSVVVGSGVLGPTIFASLILGDTVTKSTTFNVAGGTYLDISGSISESASYTGQSITLTGGGTLYFDATNSYTGSTTVNDGSVLYVGFNGTPSTLGTGTSPLAINDSNSAVYLYNSAGIGSLSGTGGGTLSLATSGTTLTVNQTGSTQFNGTLSLGSGTNLSIAGAMGSMLTLTGSMTFTGGNALNVNSGALVLNNTVATTMNGAVSVTVQPAGTLQLAGSVSALSDPNSGNMAAVTNHGSIASGGQLYVTGTNQAVGVITGTGVTSMTTGATTYDGDTVVGDGVHAADLTATQILQNSLTINAGSTVTIAPSTGVGGGAIPATSATAPSAAVASGDASGSGSDSSGSDPFTAIQAAIASGAISSTTGEVLENRIAAIERLAATDPGLDVSLLESRVLAVLPSSFTAIDSSLPTGALSGTLAFDEGTFGASLPSQAASADFASSATFTGSPAAVPEPASLLLALVGGLGLVIMVWHRTKRQPAVAHAPPPPRRR